MQRSFLLTRRVWLALIIASLVGVGLNGVGMLRNHSFDFWYLTPNLALGLIPLLFAVWLQRLLQKQRWNSWLPLVVTFFLILFLPNSFYIVSDFIHLTEMPRVDITQDIVMLAQFSFVGLTFGFISLYMLHQELIKRVSAKWAAPLVAALLLVCSFAIYLGRDLRWNSWDIVVQPFALLTDIFEHVLNPFVHPQALMTTLSFFVMLGSMYLLLWQIGKLLPDKSYNKKI